MNLIFPLQKDFADDFSESHLDKVNVHKSGLKATVPDDR